MNRPSRSDMVKRARLSAGRRSIGARLRPEGAPRSWLQVKKWKAIGRLSEALRGLPKKRPPSDRVIDKVPVGE